MRTARRWFSAARAGLASTLVLALGMIAARAEPVIPGTGQKLAQVGDDFENEAWEYLFNVPKGTRDMDEQDRFPAGEAANGRWYEGMRRGQPDVIRRVPAPEGGLPGSRGALLLQSLWTGIPGQPRNYLGQDDFIADVNYRLAGTIPAARSPSVVVRVFLPPVDTWENRTGPHFGFRAALEANVVKSTPGVRFSQSRSETEAYWPGMFIEFQSKASERDNDYASLRIRANEKGEDFRSQPITATGWWTLGISITPDGMVHYFASPGPDALTQTDHLGSQYPYGYRAEAFRTFFFNVCNGDDGRNWSTAWVIDDPSVYVAR